MPVSYTHLEVYKRQVRDRRLIGYSQMDRRFYYRPEEVRRLIPLIGTIYPDGK